jgi:hypothetical protein
MGRLRLDERVAKLTLVLIPQQQMPFEPGDRVTQSYAMLRRFRAAATKRGEPVPAAQRGTVTGFDYEASPFGSRVYVQWDADGLTDMTEDIRGLRRLMP